MHAILRTLFDRHRRHYVLLGLLSLFVAFSWVSVFAGLPDPATLHERRAPATTKIVDREGRLLHEVLDPRAGRRTWVRLDTVPDHMLDAVIAVEDEGFWSHPGVEARGLARAVWQGAREGRIVSGGSTITMQLARIALLDQRERGERSIRRKIREIALALSITRRFPKEEVLELYLNEVYFGQLAYGIEAASRTYFGKPIGAVDLAEAAMLAGLIQSPALVNPLVDRAAAGARQRLVLDRMVRSGFVLPEDAALASAEELHLVGVAASTRAPHFVHYALAVLEAEYGAERIAAGGLTVITTLDLDLQGAAEQAVAQHLAALQRPAPDRPARNVGNAALVAISPAHGDVVAMVGSANYREAAIDGAVNVALAARQPGSALKPLIYAAAFDVDRWGARAASTGRTDFPELPFTPATMLTDVPTDFPTAEGEPYRPINYDRAWHGPISLRRALATSSNLVAVKVLERVGLGVALDTASALGLTTFQNRERLGLAVALGGGEVKLMELTGAYAALAQMGTVHAPRVILGVFDSRDFAEVREDLDSWHASQPAPVGRNVLSPAAAWLVTDILSDDGARLPAFGEGSALALGRPAAAKTGTTTDFRDNWTVGYTPDLAAGVWVGNSDGAPMRHVSGITGAAPIWNAFMQAAHRGLPARTFEEPEGIARIEVCAASGLLPTKDCTLRVWEHFASGTQPRTTDDTQVRLGIDAATGGAWRSGCAGPRVERVFRLVPPSAAAWALQRTMPSPPNRPCTQLHAARTVGAAPTGGFDDTDAGGPTRRTPALAAPALRIEHPAPGTTFALSALLPTRAQRVPLIVRPGGHTQFVAITLLVDEVPVATLRAEPWRWDWSLEPGRHSLRAVGRSHDGRAVESAPVQFLVLDERTADVLAERR